MGFRLLSVIVPFDGSAHAERGLEHAIEHHPYAAITVLSIVDPLSRAGGALSDAPLGTGSDAHADDEDLQAAERFTRKRALTCELPLRSGRQRRSLSSTRMSTPSMRL